MYEPTYYFWYVYFTLINYSSSFNFNDSTKCKYSQWNGDLGLGFELAGVLDTDLLKFYLNPDIETK